MRAGSRKGWASKTQDFFCCHGSVVQANAAHNQYLYYQDGANLYAAQYFDSTARFSIGSTNVTLIQKQDSLSGSSTFQVQALLNRRFMKTHSVIQFSQTVWAICMRIEMNSPCADFSLKLRIPDWACARTDSYAGNPAVFQDVCFELNGKQMPVDAKDGFLTIQRNWQMVMNFALFFLFASLQSLQTMIQILLHFVLDQSHLPAFAVKSARFTHTVMSFKHFCFMIMNVNGETGNAHSAHAIRKQVFVSSLSTTLDMNLIKFYFPVIRD